MSPRATFVDTHLHLEDLPDWRAAADEAEAAGVVGMIAMGVDAASSRRALEMAEAHPAVWAAAGHHPLNQAPPDLQALRALTAHPRVVAIGEIGLDHSGDEHAGPPDAQAEWFDACCALAVEVDLPVCVHIRDTAAEVEATLRRHPGLRAVIHYWSLDAGWARRFLELGAYISFAGTLTRATKEHIREVARIVPEDRLLLETDAPWGTPQGRSGPMRPAWMIDTAHRLAELRAWPPEKLAEIEKANVRSLFPRVSC